MCYTNEANSDNECRLLFQLLLVVQWDSRDWHWDYIPIITIIIMVITTSIWWLLPKVRHLAVHVSSLSNLLSCRVDVVSTCDFQRFSNLAKVTELLKVNTKFKPRLLYLRRMRANFIFRCPSLCNPYRRRWTHWKKPGCMKYKTHFFKVFLTLITHDMSVKIRAYIKTRHFKG